MSHLGHQPLPSGLYIVAFTLSFFSSAWNEVEAHHFYEPPPPPPGEGGIFYHPVDLSYEEYVGGMREERGMVPSACPGVCLPPGQCATTGGTPSSLQTSCNPTGGTPRICCTFGGSCEESSDERSGVFTSPGYPAPSLSTLVCQYHIHIRPGVCAIRLEFLEFNTTRPLDRGLCSVDQFLILNAVQGATFPRCGDLTGYTTVVWVNPRHRLPLSLLSIIQSSHEQFKWNIRFTQLSCDAVSQVQDDSNCDKFESTQSFSEGTQGSLDKKEDAPQQTNRIDADWAAEAATHGDQIFFTRNSVDNAFYIGYLKKAHEALILSSLEKGNGTKDSNSTLCRDLYSDPEAKGKERLDRSTEEDELGRIIRGHESLLHEFPWQVSIQDEKGHFCGGAIISPRVILTAAHCFLSVAPLPLNGLRIVVGEMNLNVTSGEEETVHPASILFHSHFDPYYLENDLALVILNSSLTYRPAVRPICLPQQGNSYSGSRAVISGWGATSYPGGKLASHLQRTAVTIVENSECKAKLGIDYLYSTMMCAVAPNCSGTCFGDSGGPLVVRTSEGKSVLLGLVSFGIGGCALFPYWPDVYTRLSLFLDWISYATHP